MGLWEKLLGLLERLMPYLAGYLAALNMAKAQRAEARADALESRLGIERDNGTLTHADRLRKLAAKGRVRGVPANNGKP